MNAQKWVAIWGSSPSISEPHPARYAKDITLRYVLRAMLDGEKIRLHLSNLGGHEDVVIPRVYVAPVTQGSDTDESRMLPVTFGGDFPCRMAAGESVESDIVELPLKRGQDYAVSLYLGDMTLLASGTKDTGPLCRAFFAEGDFAACSQLDPFYTAPMNIFYFLTGVDALCSEDCHALVCFGDSITAQSWPDYLMLRVLRDGPENLSVIRRGIGGSRVLRSYQHVLIRHYGQKGADRFEREVAAAGADRVIVLHGVNDLIHPDGSLFRPWSDLPTAQELIDGLRYYVQRGHELGLKVYLATILSIKGWHTYNAQREEIRHAVNAWIRTQTEADGVVDFDTVTREAADPDLRCPDCDSGDHLHPSLEGAQRMAESVPAEYLK